MLEHPQVSQSTIVLPGLAPNCFFSQPQAPILSGLLYPLQLLFLPVLTIPSTRHHVQSPRERWRRDSESLWMNSVEWAMLPRRVVAVRTMTLSGLRAVPFCSHRESPGLLLRRRTQGRECPGSAEPLTWSLQSPALPFLLGQGSGRALTGRGSWRSVITGEGVGCWARAGSRVRSTWA